MRPLRFLFMLMLNDITNVNFLQKSKLESKEKLEKQHILHLFNTKPIKIIAYHDITQRSEEEIEEENKNKLTLSKHLNRMNV